MDNDRGQSLITKYVWVIDTIYRKRKISFKELNELWLRDEISRGVDIPKRTFDNWRSVIFDMFGINIVNENRGEYRYYIEYEEDICNNGVRSWLYNTLSVGNALAKSQGIRNRILLEYVPSGQEYLQPIIEAMKENRVLNITYHSYWKDEETPILIITSRGPEFTRLIVFMICMLRKKHLKCLKAGMLKNSSMVVLVLSQTSALSLRPSS